MQPYPQLVGAQLAAPLDAFNYFTFTKDYLPAIGFVVLGAVAGGLTGRKGRRTKRAAIGGAIGTGLGASYLALRWTLDYRKNY